MKRTKIYAVTDIGSNTVKCDVFKVVRRGQQQSFEAIDFFSEKLGLIARVEDSRLPANTIDLLCETVADFNRRAESLGCESFHCFGTAVMRRITNSDQVCSALLQRTGMKLDLISGEDEALLSFAGARMTDPEAASGIMIDMGGASTELIDFTNDKVNRAHSFGFGCLYLYKRFVTDRFPTSEEADAVRRFVADEVSKMQFSADQGKAVLIGGTGKAIKTLLCRLGHYSDENNVALLYELAERFKHPDENDVALLCELIPARVETIMPGLIAYISIAEQIKAERFSVSGGGIREGYLKRITERDDF